MHRTLSHSGVHKTYPVCMVQSLIDSASGIARIKKISNAM
jgi:hypothetical protein